MMSILSAILLALAFPKTAWFWLAWVALVPFFIVLFKTSSWKQALGRGFVFGLVFFGINLFWINTLNRFVGYWAILGWLALIVFQALFLALFAFLAYFIISNVQKKTIKLIGIALVWVGVEYLRALGIFGITGGGVGYTQAPFTLLIQIAFFTSVYGISFLVVLFNAALAAFILNRKNWLALLIAIVLIGACVGYSGQVLDQDKTDYIELALIQPNIDQIEKMNPASIGKVFKVHKELSLQAAKSNPQVIIWPETSVFTYLLKDQGYFGRLKKLAATTEAWLIIGTPHYEKSNQSYNAIVSISPSGEVVSTYYKQHLVPFGEYLPFRKILFPLLKSVGYFNYDYAEGKKYNNLKVDNLNLTVSICFESTFPWLIKKRVGPDTDFILNLTNDAWFDDSSALYQHLDSNIFRAVENRKYFVQVGNTGITTLIDPYGRVLQKTQVNEQKVLQIKIPLR